MAHQVRLIRPEVNVGGISVNGTAGMQTPALLHAQEDVMGTRLLALYMAAFCDFNLN
tara:strand:+ start:116 stop:286 length:171 start_codon:yes stop_codon:yes gene_type:complete